MAAILLIPSLHLFILIGFNLILIIIFLIQLLAGLWNIIMNCYYKNAHLIFNLYIYHHLIICIIRCIMIFFTCFSIIIYKKCLSIEIFLHFLLLLSTIDLLLIIISETAHFWDSTINNKSTLYSKYCLLFGIIFNYMISIIFLSIHIIMNGDNSIIIEICQIEIKKKDFFLLNNNNEKSLIPIMITYVIFILIDLLTFSWIYISYRDICHLKRKRLATIFFNSLIFTKFKKTQRLIMINQSLKRLLYICLFVISNIIVILPILTIKIFHISLNINERIILIYLTTLPWIDCITFLFYNETKFNRIKFLSKKIIFNENYYRQQRIGRRLSSYKENIIDIQTIEEN